MKGKISNDIDAAALEDANSLFEVCERIFNKLESGELLTQEDKSDLKGLLETIKENIDKGIGEGTSSGIDKYINSLS